VFSNLSLLSCLFLNKYYFIFKKKKYISIHIKNKIHINNPLWNPPHEDSRIISSETLRQLEYVSKVVRGQD
jgi:hypothetical protein